MGSPWPTCRCTTTMQPSGTSSGPSSCGAGTSVRVRGEMHRLAGMAGTHAGQPDASALLRFGARLDRDLDLQDLALDVDLDLVADDELAIEHRVEVHAEILAVDLGLGRVTDAVAHRRVVELTVLDDVQRDRLGGALDGQVASDGVAVAADVLDLRALECHGRVLVDLEKVGRTEVVVAGLVVGADAGRVDGRLDL